MGIVIVGAVVIVLWVLLEMKTSRPDGTFIKKIPPFRRMLNYVETRRDEAVVYFDREVRADLLEQYVAEAKGTIGANVTHCVVSACLATFNDEPRMNQFVVGRRLYKRKEIQATFSMKRQKLNRKAYLSAVKLSFQPDETFADFVKRCNEGIGAERSGKKTASDKEFDVLGALPRPLLRFAVWLAATLDYFNLLPGWFIDGDAMYTGIFVANLGSLGMGAGYHHLYEWGTCPLFLMVGKVQDKVIVNENGEFEKVRMMPLRFSYDERIADGLNAHYGIEGVARRLEDPYTFFGCLADDGSDARKVWPGPHRPIDPGDESAYTPPR